MSGPALDKCIVPAGETGPYSFTRHRWSPQRRRSALTTLSAYSIGCPSSLCENTADRVETLFPAALAILISNELLSEA